MLSYMSELLLFLRWVKEVQLYHKRARLFYTGSDLILRRWKFSENDTKISTLFLKITVENMSQSSSVWSQRSLRDCTWSPTQLPFPWTDLSLNNFLTHCLTISAGDREIRSSNFSTKSEALLSKPHTVCEV